MSVLSKHYVVEMPNGERWSIPVNVIAMDRAKYYSKEFDGDENKSLEEDTAPLFQEDEYEIEDWARNNMNWSDVQSHAVLYKKGECDYDEGWVNGEREVL